MQKLVLLALFVTLLGVALSLPTPAKQEVEKRQTQNNPLFTPPAEVVEGLKRLKRGHGGGGHGHGPGKGGGAAGPVYICGYVGSKEGYGGYGK